MSATVIDLTEARGIAETASDEHAAAAERVANTNLANEIRAHDRVVAEIMAEVNRLFAKDYPGGWTSAVAVLAALADDRDVLRWNRDRYRRLVESEARAAHRVEGARLVVDLLRDENLRRNRERNAARTANWADQLASAGIGAPTPA